MAEKTVYLGGCLFDLRHLAGNAILAEQVEKCSNGLYQVYLPQDYEPEHLGAKAIRDSDFKALLKCDAAVFQFDGTELDSGTVAEFMAAKFSDIPAVLLRTDFRRGGDRNEEPWNLMCSFYPRTVSLVVDAMRMYSENGCDGRDGLSASKRSMEQLAESLVEKLDEALSQAPVPVDGLSREQALRSLLGI